MELLLSFLREAICNTSLNQALLTCGVLVSVTAHESRWAYFAPCPCAQVAEREVETACCIPYNCELGCCCCLLLSVKQDFLHGTPTPEVKN